MDVKQELRSVNRTRKLVNAMLWFIVLGAVFYSLMTSTPLVSAHSPWGWSGWILGLLTDAAFVLALSADAVLSKHGLTGGSWPAFFRWSTGAASLFLNTWSSVSEADWVGVVIHSIAPLVLVCAAEVAPIYRRKFRDLENALTVDVKVDKVTRAVAPKRKVDTAKVDTKEVDRVDTGQVDTGRIDRVDIREVDKVDTLTPAKRAIRDGFMSNKSAAEVAREIGKSRSYVSAEYKKIRDSLEKAA